MLGNTLSAQSSIATHQITSAQRHVYHAQESIYSFLLEIVKTWQPEDVLQEFKQLFIHHVNTTSSLLLPHLYEIVFANQEWEFHHTLKRSCYILINNWDLSRNHQSIQQLVALFSDPVLEKPTVSPTLRRLRNWLKNFVASPDFQDLQLFVSRYEDRQQHWSQRYTSYLLASQYIDPSNPLEQRQAARALARQLKDRFKFQLAMYTAMSPSISTRKLENPTGLGDEGLRFIKQIVAKRGFFSYPNLAHIFINQTQNLCYQDFKSSLQNYLIFSIDKTPLSRSLKTQLSEKFDRLYSEHNDKIINEALLLRTANRVIDYLTTENREEPSALFSFLISQGNPLTLVILLLKIVLMCRYSYTHLEARIADLVRYYQPYPEEDCRWVIHFLEIFNITMTIYTGNVQYNLVNMAASYPSADFSSELGAYRIFSQLKQTPCTELSQEIQELLAIEETLAAEHDERLPHYPPLPEAI